MPEADVFEAPQGKPFHGDLLQAITEAVVGNGIQNDGDGEVTADANTALGIDVAACTDLRYGGSAYSVTASSFTLSAGPTSTTNGVDDRRVDAVVFDRTLNSGSGGYDVVEGSPHPNPTPPSISTDQYLLAICLVGHDASDIVDDNILNWRAHAAVSYPTSSDDLADGSVGTSKLSDDAVTTVKIATDAVDTDELAADAVTAAKIVSDVDLEVMRSRDNEVTAGLSGGTNPGAFGALFDVAVDSNSAAGDVHSYTIDVGGSSLLTLQAESDGSGGIQNAKVLLGQPIDVGGNDVVDGGTVLFDSSEGLFNRSALETDFSTTTVSSDATTSDDEVIFVDTSASAITITLATADATTGNAFRIVDIGANASSNNITVETEGGETIDGASSTTVDTDSGSLTIVSNGTNWFTAGGGGGTAVVVEDDGSVVVDPASAVNFQNRLDVTDDGDGTVTVDVSGDLAERVRATESGTVAAGNSGVVYITQIEDGRTLNVYQAGLLLADGQAAPTDLDLVIATLDNAGSATHRSDIVTGDGTVQSDVTGTPVASYSNGSGGVQTVAILVDNGNFNAGTGSGQDILATAYGAIEV